MLKTLVRLAVAVLLVGILAVIVPARTGSADGNTGIYWVNSTAYALPGGMANGQTVHDGAVACNFLPFGTRVLVLDGSLAGRILTVEDRIGWGSDFDIWLPSEAACMAYGRQHISIQIIPDDPLWWAESNIGSLLAEYGASVRQGSALISRPSS
jgi:3D (Asp-Asp-Asp) domain-containing protein